MADMTSRPHEQRAYPDIATQRAELHRLMDAITNQTVLWALTQLAQSVLPAQDQEGGRARRSQRRPT